MTKGERSKELARRTAKKANSSKKRKMKNEHPKVMTWTPQNKKLEKKEEKEVEECTQK